jgi:hypothetical protein
VNLNRTTNLLKSLRSTHHDPSSHFCNPAPSHKLLSKTTPDVPMTTNLFQLKLYQGNSQIVGG